MPSFFRNKSLLDEGYCPTHSRVLIGERMYCPDCEIDWKPRRWWWNIWARFRREDSFDDYKGADHE